MTKIQKRCWCLKHNPPYPACSLLSSMSTTLVTLISYTLEEKTKHIKRLQQEISVLLNERELKQSVPRKLSVTQQDALAQGAENQVEPDQPPAEPETASTCEWKALLTNSGLLFIRNVEKSKPKLAAMHKQPSTVTAQQTEDCRDLCRNWTSVRTSSCK